MTETTPAPRASDAVRVKELEWVHDDVHGGWYGNTPVAFMPGYRVRNNQWSIGLGGMQYLCGTEAEAKAAAQADFNARILSAIEPPVASSGGMAEAVEEAADYIENQHFSADRKRALALAGKLRAALSLRSTEAVEPVAATRAWAIVQDGDGHFKDGTLLTDALINRENAVEDLATLKSGGASCRLEPVTVTPVAAQQEGWVLPEDLAGIENTLEFYISDCENGLCRMPRGKLIEIRSALRALAAAKLGRP